MTVVGDDIVKSCRKCWSENSFGMKLSETNGKLHCAYCKSNYVLEKGFLKQI